MRDVLGGVELRRGGLGLDHELCGGQAALLLHLHRRPLLLRPLILLPHGCGCCYYSCCRRPAGLARTPVSFLPARSGCDAAAAARDGATFFFSWVALGQATSLFQCGWRGRKELSELIHGHLKVGSGCVLVGVEAPIISHPHPISIEQRQEPRIARSGGSAHMRADVMQ